MNKKLTIIVTICILLTVTTYIIETVTTNETANYIDNYNNLITCAINSNYTECVVPYIYLLSYNNNYTCSNSVYGTCPTNYSCDLLEDNSTYNYYCVNSQIDIYNYNDEYIIGYGSYSCDEYYEPLNLENDYLPNINYFLLGIMIIVYLIEVFVFITLLYCYFSRKLSLTVIVTMFLIFDTIMIVFNFVILIEFIFPLSKISSIKCSIVNFTIPYYIIVLVFIVFVLLIVNGILKSYIFVNNSRSLKTISKTVENSSI